MTSDQSTVKPVYKGHLIEPENVAFMSSCSLYTGYIYCALFINGKNDTALYRQVWLYFKWDSFNNNTLMQRENKTTFFSKYYFLLHHTLITCLNEVWHEWLKNHCQNTDLMITYLVLFFSLILFRYSKYMYQNLIWSCVPLTVYSI